MIIFHFVVLCGVLEMGAVIGYLLGWLVGIDIYDAGMSFHVFFRGEFSMTFLVIFAKIFSIYPKNFPMTVFIHPNL